MHMRNSAIIVAYISLTLCFYSCGNGEYNHSLVELDTLPAPVQDESMSEKGEIIIPLTFDPKTPLTDELRNVDLQEMVIDRYYSFKNLKIAENIEKYYTGEQIVRG